MPANKGNRPKSKSPQSGTQTAASLSENGELLAVITAAIAAFCEEETPVVTAFREAAVPAESDDFYDEETPAPASSFVVRTIKRRG